jgi:hypothetical protein
MLKRENVLSICKPLIDIMSYDNQLFERGVAVIMLVFLYIIKKNSG